MRNPELVIIDSMLHEKKLTLKQATKCWWLVRRRVTAREAVTIVMGREKRKQERKKEVVKGIRRKAHSVSLEELVRRQERLADLILMANRYSEWGNIEEGFNPNDALNQKTVRLRTEQKFDIDYCYSNTDGAEYLF